MGLVADIIDLFSPGIAAPVGGSIQSVSINDREFRVAADADATLDIGGLRTAEMRTFGDQSAHPVQKVAPWMVDGLALQIGDSGDPDDFTFLSDIAAGKSGEVVAITVSLISGEVFGGRGTIIGDIVRSSMNMTAPIRLGGPGQLTKLAQSTSFSIF